MSQCPHCLNTGSLSKELTGRLDCARCAVADQRAELAIQLNLVAPEPGPLRDWAAFQLGRLAEGVQLLGGGTK